MSDSLTHGERCDHPACLSRATLMYLVGLRGFPAFYCLDHAPKPGPDDVVLSNHVFTVDSNQEASQGHE